MSFVSVLTMNAMKSRYKTKISNLNRSLDYFKTRCQILEQIIYEIDPKLVPPGNVSGQAAYLKRDRADDALVPSEAHEMTLGLPEPFATFFLSSVFDNINRHPQGRRWSPTVLMLSYVLRNLGAKCYDYLREFIPLPCSQTLYNNFSSRLSEWKTALLELDGVPAICDLFRRQHLLDGDVEVEVVLGVDALAMEPVRDAGWAADAGDNHVFAFLILPLKCEFKPLPVHLLTQSNGNAGDAVRELLVKLVQTLNECKIVTRCIATDGDHGYHELHNQMFDRWWPKFCSEGVDETLKALKNDDNTVIADFLHLLKNARSRFLNNRVSLSPDGVDSFSAEDLNNALKLGNSLTDKSSKGRMRDSYVLEIFTLDNFLHLIAKNESHMGFYILPYCLWNEVIRNPHLSSQMRLDLLARIADIFAYHLHVIECLNTTAVSQTKRPGIP